MEKLKNAVLLLTGAVIFGVGTHCFVTPANIAPGGALGVALMLNYLSELPVGALTMAVNLPLLAMGWFYLSRRFTLSTAITSLLCSFILDFLIAPFLPVYGGDRLLGSLYGGILIGVGMALIFLSGTTTGGTDIAGYLLQKRYPHMSIGRALLLIDGVILVLSIPVFGSVDAALFGLICLYAQTKVIDAILYGSDVGSQAAIITRNPEDISKRVIEELERTVTLVPGKGAYSGKDVTVMFCIVRKSEFSRLKKIVEECDMNAFITVTETSQVFGLGFKEFN